MYVKTDLSVSLVCHTKLILFYCKPVDRYCVCQRRRTLPIDYEFSLSTDQPNPPFHNGESKPLGLLFEHVLLGYGVIDNP